jgi:hypothetical protein
MSEQALILLGIGPACHAEGRGFEPRHSRHFPELSSCEHNFWDGVTVWPATPRNLAIAEGLR